MSLLPEELATLDAKPAVSPGVADLVPPAPPFPIDLPTLIREFELRCITAALERTAGNKKAAADLLGLRRTTLVEKLRRSRLEEGALDAPVPSADLK